MRKFLGIITLLGCLALATPVISARAQSSGPMWGAISPGSYPTPNWSAPPQTNPSVARRKNVQPRATRATIKREAR
jgi:hypothetical protein